MPFLDFKIISILLDLVYGINARNILAQNSERTGNGVFFSFTCEVSSRALAFASGRRVIFCSSFQNGFGRNETFRWLSYFPENDDYYDTFFLRILQEKEESGVFTLTWAVFFLHRQ